MNDEQLAVRLREAVAHEADAVPGGQTALADRLLRGARPGRRRRPVTAAVAAAAVLAVALSGAGLLLARQGDDTLLSPDPAGTDPVLPVMSVSEAGAVTPDMAAREGLDGTAQCQSEAVKPQPDGAGVGPELRLYAAYLTDAEGFARWGVEYGTGVTVSRGRPETVPTLIAICWYAGDVPRDGSAGGPGLPAPTHQVVVLQLRGSAGMPGLRQDLRSPRPLPVLAPDPPAGLAPDDAVGRQGLRAFPQPEGVAVVDQLPRRSPPPEVEPVDCTPTACSDPNEETIVAAEVTVGGERLDPRGARELEAGERVEVTLTLQVEDGQAIRDVHLGLSSGGHGAGPEGPIGLEEVLLREPGVTGTRTFETAWTVPADARERQLVLYYVFDKYQEGTRHSRTLGGVAAAGG